jgi:hypothetical protein
MKESRNHQVLVIRVRLVVVPFLQNVRSHMVEFLILFVTDQTKQLGQIITVFKRKRETLFPLRFPDLSQLLHNIWHFLLDKELWIMELSFCVYGLEGFVVCGRLLSRNMQNRIQLLKISIV